MRLAAFVTSHGFGHAARVSAVLTCLRRRRPRARIELFTTVPRWFFDQSLPPGSFRLHEELVDLGLVQKDARREDIPATLRRYRSFYPLSDALLDRWAARLRRLGCTLALCDISPLGLLAAERAGIPSVLLENFTWDWILGGYPTLAAPLTPYRRILAAAFARAGLRLRARPACGPSDGHASVPPVARAPRTPARRLREALAVPRGSRLVLVSVGADAPAAPFLRLADRTDGCIFVLAGRSPLGPTRHRRVRALAPDAFYHPDLIAAADAVAGKIGYSTLAEACVTGTPFGYVPRDTFRESPVLERHLRARGLGVRIEPDRFDRGLWDRELRELLARAPEPEPNGADEAACRILTSAGARP